MARLIEGAGIQFGEEDSKLCVASQKFGGPVEQLGIIFDWEVVELGVVYEQVLKAIEQSHADLVVVRSQKPDMADQIAEANSATIARYAPISTLVLRL